MSFTGSAKFACSSCGKQYTWKPALAGKQAKCACGAVMLVPAQPPPDEPDELYGLADGARGESATPTVAPRTVAAPVAAPAPAQTLSNPITFPSAARSRNAESDADEPSKTKKLVTGVVVLALVLASLFALVKIIGQSAKRTPAPALGDDAYVESQLNDGATDDIEAWLDKSNRRMVMGMSNSQAKALAANLKRMGAKRVVAFGAAMSMSLGVELPADPKQRKALFDWEREHHHDWRKPPPKDVGQKWLLVMMKP